MAHLLKSLLLDRFAKSQVCHPSDLYHSITAAAKAARVCLLLFRAFMSDDVNAFVERKMRSPRVSRKHNRYRASWNAVSLES